MYSVLYKQKVVSPKDAVDLIPKTGNLVVGMAVCAPNVTLLALEEKIKNQEIEHLNLYYMHATQQMHNSVLKYEYLDIVKPHPFYMGPVERKFIQMGMKERKKTVYFIPANFSQVPKILSEKEIDVTVIMVAPMDSSGFFRCGTNSDYSIAAARHSKKVIVEVNKFMPRSFGDCFIHVSDVHAIVEHDLPLIQVEPAVPDEIDRKVGLYVTNMIPNRATLQFGIGKLPSAICELLVNHKDLGIHTELVTDSVVDLILSGAVTNRYKNINKFKSVFTFAFGTDKTYNFIQDNFSMELYTVDYVNDPNRIALNDNVVSINSFLEIDLNGQVNAEAIHNFQYTGMGGQLDFVRGSQLSKNGKSILAAHSTCEKGTVSRIVSRLDGPTTDVRAEVHNVVTEYGVASLRGKSVPERAKALISIAHPKFREELEKEAAKMGIF